LEDVQEQGDERRQASTHLVREGLRDDAADAPDLALDRYRMALRVDPSNPWAYLALARHELDRDEPRRALAALERSRSLLELEGPPPPRVEAHLVGLRGAVLEALGRHDEARPLLAEARDRAPGVWSDGHLHPDELR
jgi:tetratricopeptide (TPR) repeat protein